MNYRQPLAATLLDPQRAHRSAAAGRTVAWLDVEMTRPEAGRAVIAVAPVAQRRDRSPAVAARDTLIFGRPADGSASGLKK